MLGQEGKMTRLMGGSGQMRRHLNRFKSCTGQCRPGETAYEGQVTSKLDTFHLGPRLFIFAPYPPKIFAQ